MKIPFSGLFREWKELERFNSLDPADRAIVFYAEDAGSWAHLGPIVDELTGAMGRKICYVTSSADDPVLEIGDDRVFTFCVGSGPARTSLFRKLQSGVMVMTMPERQRFHFRHSESLAHYVFVHHSMVSTHMIYAAGAFDNFDTVLCVGPHHMSEIEERESLLGLEPKNLVAHGYGRLDSIIRNSGGALPDGGPRKRVLIAPSWGKEALIEVCGSRLVQVLIEADYQVTVRPHPMTILHSRRVISDLESRFDGHPLVELESDVSSEQSLHFSDIMISDWSGAALEYAFGLERPVIFIDVPRKVLNPDYKEISCVPVEVSLRDEIGAVVSVDALHEVPSHIERLCGDLSGQRERLRELREEWVYNVGSSGSVGAEYIAQAADRAIIS
jgi:hypothetical protein